jgi:hypothetical protein
LIHAIQQLPLLKAFGSGVAWQQVMGMKTQCKNHQTNIVKHILMILLSTVPTFGMLNLAKLLQEQNHFAWTNKIC